MIVVFPGRSSRDRWIGDILSAAPHDPLEAAHHAATTDSGTPDGALRKDCVMGDKSQKNKDKKQKTAMKAKAAKAAKAPPAQR